jgi:cytidylate kinase
MSDLVANIVGLIGSALFIVAFGYANLATAMDKTLFNAMNLIGSVLLLISLSVNFNLPSFVLESVWGVIALAGLVASLRGRRAGPVVIIAVDGPAASGKGTIAKALAARYDLPHLDTGLLYRAVGISVLRAGGDPGDEDDAFHACGFDDSLLGDANLKSEAAGKAASIVSAHPAVRAALLERQRAFAHQAGGAVLDGRDIGTVIAPEATAKLFVTASPEVRAQRRYDELIRMGLKVALDHVLSDIRTRDERDSARSAAPLRRADDAVLLDTSDLGVEAAIAAAVRIVAATRG